MNVSVYKPVLKRKDMDAVLSVMVKECIGPGEVSRKLCMEVSRIAGFEKGIAVRERRRALDIALRGLELEAGQKVVISALSPAYYADVLKDRGLQPVYADVDPDSGTMTSESVEAVSSAGLSAMIVHYPFGYIPEMEKLSELELPVIEDISHAVFARLDDRAIGTFGAFALVEMEWDSLLTAAGGALVFPSHKKYRKIVKPLIEELSSDQLLPDLNASLALIQLDFFEKYLGERNEIGEIFKKSVMKSRHKTFIQRGEWKNIPYCFPVVLQSAMNDVIQYSHKKGIMAQPAFVDCVMSRYPLGEYPCPSAQNIMMRTVLFPLYPALGNRNIELISKTLATLP